MKQKQHPFYISLPNRQEKSTKEPRKGLEFGAMAGFGLFWLCCALFPTGTFAQQTLNATGGTGTIGGDTYSYSIGEMVLVSTFQNANFGVTQGLLQGAIGGLGVEEVFLTGGLEVYPNPVSSSLFIQPDFQGGGELQLKLYDLLGRLVLKRQSHLQSGGEKQRLDLSILQEGTYLLKADFTQDGKTYPHTFKILKTSN